jgi:hypothetical protein
MYVRHIIYANKLERSRWVADRRLYLGFISLIGEWASWMVFTVSLVLVERSDIALDLCVKSGGREAKLLVCKEGKEKGGDQINFNFKLLKLQSHQFWKNTHGIILMREHILLLLNLPTLNLQIIYRGQYIFFQASILEESWVRQQQVTAVLCLDSRPYCPSFRKFLQSNPATGRPGLNHHTCTIPGR